ncbi:MAG: hypothetical protein AAGG75_14610 [Bacteroidota bacterium]
MKILHCAIIYLFLTGTYSHSSKTISQNFHLDQHIQTLVTDLDGEVELIHWDEDMIRVETTIRSNLSSKDGLDYAIGKGDYRLVPNTAEQRYTLVLRTKKLIPTVLIKGQIQKTRQHYKVFVPSRVVHTR